MDLDSAILILGDAFVFDDKFVSGDMDETEALVHVLSIFPLALGLL